MVLRLETQNEGYIVRPSSGFGGSVEKSYMLQQPQGRNDFHMILKYSQTMRMAMRAQTNGGIFYLLPNIAVRLVHLIPLLFLWSVLSRSGVETGMTLYPVQIVLTAQGTIHSVWAWLCGPDEIW